MPKTSAWYEQPKGKLPIAFGIVDPMNSTFVLPSSLITFKAFKKIWNYDQTEKTAHAV